MFYELPNAIRLFALIALVGFIIAAMCVVKQIEHYNSIEDGSKYRIELNGEVFYSNSYEIIDGAITFIDAFGRYVSSQSAYTIITNKE